MKRIGTFLLVSGAASAMAQTPPLQPQTPNVKVPPPIVLPSPAELGRRELTAEEAVAIALRNQPLVGIARADVMSAQGRRQQTQSDLFPFISFGGSLSETRNLRGGGGVPNRFNSNLSVDQLLFDFGRTRDAIRQQDALVRAEERAFSRTEQLVALDTKQFFYNHTEDLRLVEISEANVASRQRQLDLAQARLNTGFGAPADVVRAKTGLAEAVISLASARNAATNSRVQLAQQMGIDPRTPITPAPSTESSVSNEDELQSLVEFALINRPDVLEAQARLNASRFAVSVAQKTNAPRISATGTLGARGANDPLQSSTATFGINVSWTFTDGGFAAGRVREMKGAEEASRQRLIQVSQQAVGEISQAYLDLKDAQQRLEIADVQLANARELLRISEGRYAGGLGQFLEVTDAQNSLVAAERNSTAARLDVERARARLRAAIGAK